jgi:release factor glutamine methyltransferase
MLNKIVELGYSKIEAQELIKVSKNIDEDYKKLLNQYPIQYLIGYVNFYGYKINVNENVLIPRYETEYLVEKTIKYIKDNFNSKINILDLCTGSGSIAISLSKELNCSVDASDISSKALEIARINAKENNADINYIESDLFDKINGKYDVIISNPPYISKNEKIMYSVDKYEPHEALYADDEGLFYYDKILSEIKNHLNNKYIIAFEIGYTQGEKIKKLAEKYLNNPKVLIEKDLSNKDRYVFIFSK